MNKVQKSLLIALLVILFGGIVYTSLLLFKGGKTFDENPFSYLPQESAVIFKINGQGFLKDLRNSDLSIIDQLSSFGSIHKYADIAIRCDSLIDKNPDIQNSFQNNGAYISFWSSNGIKINWLLYFKLDFSTSETTNLALVNYLIGEDFKKTSVRKYESTLIYSFQTSVDERDLYVSFFDNSFILSDSPIVIEDAIRNAKIKNSLAQDNEFLEVFRTLGKSK
ncbi:MAG: DUF3352 domain-containing protein, partial [Bacteroidales bacterium]|nr:DUF3352 domain-containing protein [Bacteroidales bacterium]